MKAITFPKLVPLIALLLLFVRRGPWFEASRAASRSSGFPQDVMAIVVSIAVLGAGLYVILSRKYPADSHKWAYGAVGTIVGFWLA